MIAVLSLVLLTLTKVLPSKATSTNPPSTPSVIVTMLSPLVLILPLRINSLSGSLLQLTSVLPCILSISQ